MVSFLFVFFGFFLACFRVLKKLQSLFENKPTPPYTYGLGKVDTTSGSEHTTRARALRALGGRRPRQGSVGVIVALELTLAYHNLGGIDYLFVAGTWIPRPFDSGGRGRAHSSGVYPDSNASPRYHVGRSLRCSACASRSGLHRAILGLPGHEALAQRTSVAHVYGDANPTADAASRGYFPVLTNT